MSRRTRAVGTRSWLPAAAGSLAAHGLVLALAVLLAETGGASPQLELAAAARPDWIDVVAPPPTVEASAAPDQDQAKLAEVRLDDAREGDSDHDPSRAQAPRDGDTRVRRAPAPDAGDQQGTTQGGAWRRDRATLRARLSDGAATYQPSHRRTPDAGRSSSPQAERREPTVGKGDQVRPTPDTRAAAEEPRAERDLDPAGDAAGRPGDEAPRPPEPVAAHPELPRPAVVGAAVPGVGALDAERGARAFDTQVPGRAVDDRDQRAASDELRPAIIDLSRSAAKAPVETPRGHGPAAVPGAVAQAVAVQGAAPARYGAPAAADVGPDVDERTQDRQYQRYFQEIARRVRSVREFPKALALRLEQGETVVRFVLETDGRISGGVKVLKSSGFDEFDAAATRAVQRAAPFPPMPPTRWARPLPVSIRVAFENPVVR